MMEDQEFINWLKDEQLYPEAKAFEDGRYAAIYPLIYTYAIIEGRIGDKGGYDDRWCYTTREAAMKAYNEWNGVGEPSGWIRNPRTGRRRDETGKEWVEL